MKIELAKNYGFCFGVKRAIKIAENSAGSQDSTSATIGELIHNSLEIDNLKKHSEVELVKMVASNHKNKPFTPTEEDIIKKEKLISENKLKYEN